jgi:predicted aldo/keto reductase-like oxidoreductase
MNEFVVHRLLFIVDCSSSIVEHSMKKRTLGRTGWEVSVISFGAIKLPQLSQKECDILLNRAIDLGINLVDTADCYGDSEEKIGKALSRRRKEFYLSTKVDERDGSGVAKKLERCLRRLKTDWIDLVLFHDVRGSEYEKIFEQGGLQTLEKAKEDGKVSQIGISIHQSIPMMEKAIHSGVFSVLMIAYSAIDEDRLSADLIHLAHEKGAGLIAMKPLAGGKLGSSVKGWNLKYFKGESPAQISLRYILTNPHMTCAIPGMTHLKELEENIKVGKDLRKLTPEEINRFMDWVGETGKGFCRNCGYCLPCPEKIPIPDLFRIEGYYERYGMKKWAIEQYRQLPVKAGACSSCEQCLARCPYGVRIPEHLREIQQTFGA